MYSLLEFILKLKMYVSTTVHNVACFIEKISIFFFYIILQLSSVHLCTPHYIHIYFVYVEFT